MCKLKFSSWLASLCYWTTRQDCRLNFHTTFSIKARLFPQMRRWFLRLALAVLVLVSAAALLLLSGLGFVASRHSLLASWDTRCGTRSPTGICCALVDLVPIFSYDSRLSLASAKKQAQEDNPLDGCYHIYLDVGSNVGIQVRREREGGTRKTTLTPAILSCHRSESCMSHICIKILQYSKYLTSFLVPQGSTSGLAQSKCLCVTNLCYSAALVI